MLQIGKGRTFSLHDQASNWLERLPAGSISTWDDLTTRFLAQLFPPGRTSKLQNDIMMSQQHHVQIFYDHVNPATRRTIDQSVSGKLCDRNAKEFWALLEDLALYDNESWNDPRDFAKPVKAIALPQDVMSTFDRRLIEFKNQWSHDTQYCMEDPEQAFVEYASSRTNKEGGLVSNIMAYQDARLSKFEAGFKQQQSEMTNKIDAVLKAITDRIARALPRNK
ncbi:MAK10-like protein, partial [Tanacetum coccineum]